MNTVVPNLVCGELTVYDLSPESDAKSDWAMAVRQLVRGSIAAGVPVVYVECGGYDDSASELLRADNPSDLLKVVDDTDDWMLMPVPGEVSDAGSMMDGRLLSCGTPTLQRTMRATTEHEIRHGPSFGAHNQSAHVQPSSVPAASARNTSARRGITAPSSLASGAHVTRVWRRLPPA